MPAKKNKKVVKKASGKKRDAQVIKSLSDLGKDVAGIIKQGHDPSVSIRSRSISNVHFNERKSIIELGQQHQDRHFFNVGMARKFMQTMLVAAGCKEFVESGKTTSLRDLYYRLKHTIKGSSENTFDDQNESDPIIEDIEVTLDTLREELHLFASNRGALVGNITLVDSGDTIDCRHQGSGGWSIPSIVESNVIQFKKCDAKFVLLVEKDAVWRRLNEDKFWKKNKCILLHGQGQPTRGVRRLLWRFTNELKLPLYVFVDNDPWGLYIYSVVKQGSINLAFESSRMAVPSARFIGLSTFDRNKFDIGRDVCIKLTNEDRKRAKQILGYPWFQKKAWQKELKQMLKDDLKMELEVLSTKRNISFVSEEYLPRKIKEKDFLA
ncbi:MAG: DNA topoisomerase IV subunit A [Planctomycetota bacterium]|jgi:DNA topoisomerase-6 subunit A